MMFIIDGTGEGDDPLYFKDMNRGFCKQLELKLREQAIYKRGPALFGTETFDIANEMLNVILMYYYGEQVDINQIIADALKPKTAKPIFLAGHSRGGCAVIYIAQKLKAQGIKVNAMFLFDAVARTHKGVPIVGDDFKEIPDNVRICYHALRDRERSNHYKKPLIELFNKCVKSIPVGPVGGGALTTECGLLNKARINDTKLRVYARNEYMLERTVDFENCGTRPENNQTLLKLEKFLGCHGTMGGAITATSPLDDERVKAPDDAVLAGNEIMALEQVNNWMSEKLRNEGVLSKGQTILDKEHIQKEMQYIDKAKLYVHREFGF